MLTQGSTFTYQDVLDQLLVYTPETVSGGADEMDFILTDGIYTHTGRLEFTMDVRKSEGPRMTVNRGLQLPAGERGGRGRKEGRKEGCWGQRQQNICSVMFCVSTSRFLVSVRKILNEGLKNVLNA